MLCHEAVMMMNGMRAQTQNSGAYDVYNEVTKMRNDAALKVSSYRDLWLQGFKLMRGGLCGGNGGNRFGAGLERTATLRVDKEVKLCMFDVVPLLLPKFTGFLVLSIFSS